VEEIALDQPSYGYPRRRTYAKSYSGGGMGSGSYANKIQDKEETFSFGRDSGVGNSASRSADRNQSTSHSYRPVVGAGTKATFAPGDKVTHAKWGMGTVVGVKASRDGQEVQVAFAGQGIRSLLTKYAVLKKV
jgi:hypothetical protein